MSLELLDALYKQFSKSKDGTEKFLKHAKVLLEDGDISENDLKKFLAENDFKVENEPEKTIKKSKVKTFKDLFKDVESEDVFKPISRKTSSSSSSCGSSSPSRWSSSGCGSSSSSSRGGC